MRARARTRARARGRAGARARMSACVRACTRDPLSSRLALALTNGFVPVAAPATFSLGARHW
eukprot:2133004-Alexandrium_andersonii.AAC.1